MVNTRTACVLASAFLAAAPARAQRAAGPFAGLFGGQGASDELAQSLELRAEAQGEYDMYTLEGPGADALQDVPFLRDGAAFGVDGALGYTLAKDRVRASVNGSTALRQYTALGGYRAVTGSGDASTSVQLGRRLSATVGGAATYSPFFQLTPFLGGVLDAGTALTVGSVYQPNLLVSTTAGVTANVTRRSSVEVSGSWSEQRFVSADLGAIRQYGARARYIHRLTRTLGFHLGYGRVEGRYPGALGGPPVAVDTIDVGLDYGDRIALGRRAVLSFNTALASERYGGATHYRLNGSATLTKGLGRTWTASTGYTRNTEFLIGFPQPISTDSGTADLSGQIAPRVQVRAGVALSRGELAFGGSEALMAYSGASRLTIAASRTLGVFVQYGYYRYDIPAGWAAVPLPARFGRQTAMAGLAAWVPIVKQEKTRRGPR